jgi:hypothetical protein
MKIGNMTNTFTFDKVTLVREKGGTDRLTFQCSNAETPFPELEAQFPGEYPLFIRIETRKGYAEEWCAKMGIVIDSSVIIP